MNNTAHAVTHRAALVDCGWTCGDVEVQANGLPGFAVTQPYRVVGTGKRARVYVETKQVRAFAADGTMHVVAV